MAGTSHRVETGDKDKQVIKTLRKQPEQDVALQRVPKPSSLGTSLPPTSLPPFGGRRLPPLSNPAFAAPSTSMRMNAANPSQFQRPNQQVLGPVVHANTGKVTAMDRTQNQVNEITGIMRSNLEAVIERGDKLQDLDARADQLSLNSEKFRATTKKIKNKYWWKNQKYCICLTLTVLALLGAAVGICLYEFMPIKNGTDLSNSTSSTMHMTTVTHLFVRKVTVLTSDTTTDTTEESLVES
ncbi:hypothetical protein RvY_07614 [Ramazzottius varieornatus]|uniref:V-SNARE coiled-coil homology domain-containing protein n=1 Tax=Ramazzottius varieornatus TaxID=947166 RepID=A0A1D1V5V3_RAMVA|nr:hypothetical protein RvY_07614 [Ramazzottius varieornatus]